MYTTRDTESESEDRTNNRYNWRASHSIMYVIFVQYIVYCVLDERSWRHRKRYEGVVVTSPSNVIFIGTGSARVKLLLSNAHT